MEFTITTTQILWVCTFIGALWGLIKILKEMKKPNEELKQNVEEHARMLAKDNKRIKDIEESNSMILHSLFVIINHDITGNGIDKLKDQRDKLEKFLSSR